MKKCMKCGKELKDDQNFCDNCGYRIENSSSTSDTQFTNNQIPKKNKGCLIAFIIAIVIILIFTVAMCSNNSENNNNTSNTEQTPAPTSIQTSTPKPTPKPTPTIKPEPTPEPVKEFIKENYGYVDYSELARNPNQYIGKSLTYSGKVIQVIEGDTETQHRIAVGGNYDNVIYVAYPKDIVTSRILEDDYVTVYGTSLGLYTYKSTLGGNITIPALYLDRIELQ